MKSILVFSLAALLSLAAVLPAPAQSQPSAKATAVVGAVDILDSTGMEWTTIMSNTLKTANQKSLFVDVSLECGLYTLTKIKGKEGKLVTAKAEAGVKVQVLIDGEPASPGEVVFCRRTQELSGVFGGYFSNCVDRDLDGHITLDECELLEEELQLVLDTMNANAFNFIMDGVSQGIHTIEVQARIDADTLGGEEDPTLVDAKASIGKGSVTIEEVRLAKGDEIDL